MEALLRLPYPWADGVILGALVFSGVFGGFRRSPFCLLLLAFSIVLSAFFVSAGTKWGAVELVPAAILVGLVMRVSSEKRVDEGFTLPKPVPAVLIGLVLVAAISSWVAPVGYGAPVGVLQSPGVRPFVQAGSYSLHLLFFLIPGWLSFKRRDVAATLRAFQVGVVLSAVYGLYQLIAFEFRLPFRGIQYTADRMGMAIVDVAGVSLFRMNGLSNEPKQLAAVAIVATTTALVARSIYRHPALNIGVVVICGLAFVATWSTGGMLAATLVLAAGLIWMMRSEREFARRSLRVALGLVVLAVSVVVISGHGRRSVEIVRNIAFERVAIPMVSDALGRGERIENAVVEHFIDHPENLLSGLGLGNYPYVVGQGRWAWRTGIQPMHSVVLTLLADFGVTGVLVLIGAVFVCLKRSRVLGATGSRDESMTEYGAYRAVVAGLIASVLVSVFLNLLALILLFLGVLHAYSHALARERRSQAAMASAL